jgi:hypothetical protein
MAGDPVREPAGELGGGSSKDTPSGPLTSRRVAPVHVTEECITCPKLVQKALSHADP